MVENKDWKSVDSPKIKYENKLIIKDDSPVYSLKTNISRGFLIRQLRYNISKISLVHSVVLILVSVLSSINLFTSRRSFKVTDKDHLYIVLRLVLLFTFTNKILSNFYYQNILDVS